MKTTQKTNFRFILLLTFLGLVGVVAIFPYQITVNAALFQEQGVDISLPVMLIANMISMGITLFVLILIAERLLRRTGLGAPILNAWIHKQPLPAISTKWLFYGIGVSFIGVIIILLLDVFVFGTDVNVSVPWWQGMLAILYGGFTEELLVRFFGMTFIVWLLAKLSKKSREDIPPVYFYIAIFLAAILFGLGHLPATMQIFGELTILIVVRALVLNGLLGLWFGYLYWKKGLEYAIIAHMSADLFLHVIFGPIFHG